MPCSILPAACLPIIVNISAKCDATSPPLQGEHVGEKRILEQTVWIDMREVASEYSIFGGKRDNRVDHLVEKRAKT